MIGHLTALKRTVLAALILLTAAFAGRAESVVASTDIWYDEQTDEVVFWVYTESDYNTAWYYEVWSGSDLSEDGQVLVGWGITSQPGVPYVWGWNTRPAQPGVVYGIRTRHDVRAYYEWCEITYPYECLEWYDVFGYDLLAPEQPPWNTYFALVPPMVVCWIDVAIVAEAMTEKTKVLCGLIITPGQFGVSCNGPSNDKIYSVSAGGGSCLMSGTPSCSAARSGNVELDVSKNPNPTCTLVGGAWSGHIHLFAGPGTPIAGNVDLSVSVNVNGEPMSKSRSIPAVCQ